MFPTILFPFHLSLLKGSFVDYQLLATNNKQSIIILGVLIFVIRPQYMLLIKLQCYAFLHMQKGSPFFEPALFKFDMVYMVL